MSIFRRARYLANHSFLLPKNGNSRVFLKNGHIAYVKKRRNKWVFRPICLNYLENKIKTDYRNMFHSTIFCGDDILKQDIFAKSVFEFFQ